MLWLLHDKDRMVRLIWSQYTSVEDSDSRGHQVSLRGLIDLDGIRRNVFGPGLDHEEADSTRSEPGKVPSKNRGLIPLGDVLV